VLCSISLQVVPTDESLARVVAVLVRKRWSILELHHRRGDAHATVLVVVSKVDGETDRLRASLAREVGVISVE